MMNFILYIEPSIVKIIKIARLKWLGHISRLEDNVPCMKITYPRPEGSKKQGKPRLRWLDSVLTDLKNFEVKAWCKKARDRDLWSEIIRETKAHYGAHSAIEEEEEEEEEEKEEEGGGGGGGGGREKEEEEGESWNM
jgi:hypothetical protein